MIRDARPGRRVFVGLPIAADAAAVIGAWAETSLAASSLRVTAPVSYHVTLVFCGFVEEQRLAELIGVVADATPADLCWRLEPQRCRCWAVW